jgi:16S rRNA (guanine527-N7)-methyltransferase
VVNLAIDPESTLQDFWQSCGLAQDRWPEARQTYRRYWELVQSHNAQAGLMASGLERQDFYLKHLVDSLSVLLCCRELLAGPVRLADVGAGAGLPGVALAIALPELRLTAIESIRKKAQFLQLCGGQLGLSPRLSVLARRSREAQSQPPWHEGFDAVAARAVSSAQKMIQDCRQLLAAGGTMILYKTPQTVARELPAARRDAAKHGLAVRTSPVIELPGGVGKRQFILIGPSQP